MSNAVGSSRLFIITVLLCGTLALTVSAQDFLNSSIDSATCSPEILFNTLAGSLPVCLDTYIPGDDSCAEVDFVFKTFGVQISFYLDVDRHWKYTKTLLDSSQNRKPSLKISLTYDDNGFLVKAVYILGALTDSSSVKLDLNTDIRYDHDSIPPLFHEIRRSAFICDENVVIGKTVIREYTYPGEYGQKGQIPNYPEVSAFHWGPSVKMPKQGELEVRAYITNYWHLQTPPPIEYDDPEERRRQELYLAKWRERHPPRKKTERTRKPFLRFKPL